MIEHLRVSRDLAVVRLQLDRPMPYHAGQYVNVLCRSARDDGDI